MDSGRKKYIIVKALEYESDTGANDLEREVNYYADRGYVPHGNVAVFIVPHSQIVELIQPMVLKQKTGDST